MSNGPVVAPVSPDAVADSVYAVPAFAMLMLENVATPATALTQAVPPSVAPADPVPFVIARHTCAVNPVATFPMLSCTVTVTAGAMFAAATAEAGWVLITRSAAGPGLTLNDPLVPP